MQNCTNALAHVSFYNYKPNTLLVLQVQEGSRNVYEYVHTNLLYNSHIKPIRFSVTTNFFSKCIINLSDISQIVLQMSFVCARSLEQGVVYLAHAEDLVQHVKGALLQIFQKILTRCQRIISGGTFFYFTVCNTKFSGLKSEKFRTHVTARIAYSPESFCVDANNLGLHGSVQFQSANVLHQLLDLPHSESHIGETAMQVWGKYIQCTYRKKQEVYSRCDARDSCL